MIPTELTLRKVIRSAEDFLSAYHADSLLPIPIEEIVELKLNIEIQVIPGIKGLLGIDAFITHDFSRIVIDESVYINYPQRARFSIAHEIGHMILHRDWYQENGPQSVEEALQFQDGIDTTTYDYMERQADTFAGLVLVPKELLVIELKKIVGNVKQVSPFSSSISELAERFNVSEKVIVIRMQKDNIVTQINGLY